VRVPDDPPVLDTPLGVDVVAPIDGTGLEAGDGVAVSLRPERLSVEPGHATTDGGGPAETVAATVIERIHRGAGVRVRVRAGETELVVARPATAETPVAVGDELRLRLSPGEARYFDGSGERLR
jgi:ABC-type Fe3+/spermidine/putrescine transport system ATPase subunit